MRGNTRAGFNGFLSDMSRTPRLRRLPGHPAPIAGLDETTVEALLHPAAQSTGSGAGAATWYAAERAGEHALAELVAAARRPGRPEELAGLPAAREAFAAVSWRSARPASPRRWLIRLAGVPAALGLASTLALGGVAYAAYASALPSGWQAVAHALLGPLGVPGAPAHRGALPVPSPVAAPRASSRGSLAELPARGQVAAWCRAAEQAATGSRALPEAIRRDLIAAAGGAPRIPAFCASRVAPSASPAASPLAKPTATQQPVGAPASRRPRPTRQATPTGRSVPSGTPAAPAATSAARAQPSAGATRASSDAPTKQLPSGSRAGTGTVSPLHRGGASVPSSPASVRG